MAAFARPAGQHPGAEIWCEHKCGDPDACYRDHCIAGGRLGRAKGKVGKLKYECVVCGKHEMLFNAGDDHWMVWYCFAGCDPRAIRDGLIRRGIDPKCLGGYYSDSHINYLAGAAPKVTTPDPELLAIAGRYDALRKLVSDEGTVLLRMGATAIDEGSGDLPGRLDALLPTDPERSKEWLGIAERTGIGRGRYEDAKRWFSKQLAGVKASSLLKTS